MTRTHLSRLAAVAALLAAGTALAEDKTIPGIGPTGPLTKLEGKYGFTEGPAVDPAGDVYFSDIPNERIHKIEAATGKVSVFREKSNHANGLMVNAKGEIVACEMDGAIVAFSPDGKDRRVITDKYEGKRYNAPNDLVLDKSSGVYFTDPEFRA